ncbi:MAG: HD domain-containing protein [Rhodothermales bacterium]|nr:HD domain-containing protein [Rhodothermales bacterium]
MTRVSDILTEHALADLFRTIGKVADELSIPTYIVGGFVRDLFLHRDTTDIDFVTVGSGTGLKLAKAVSSALGGVGVHEYEQFGTAAIRANIAGYESAVQIEFVAARKESYRKASRKPIVDDGTLIEDLSRRDFTINAMAIQLNEEHYGELIDEFGGMQDLNRGVLRTPVDPDVTYTDDPLRAIRAARFAAQLGFTISAESISAMTRNAERISIVSPERIIEEIQRIMATTRPSRGLKVLYETGILKIVFPALADLGGIDTVDGRKHKDNFYHTLEVVDNLVDRLGDRDPAETIWLRWAALLHDIGKPRSKKYDRTSGWTFHGHEEIGARMVPKIFRSLRLPTDERLKYVQKMIRLHHRPVSLVDEHVTDSAVRRLLFDAADDIDDLMTLVKADITSKNDSRRRRYLKAFEEVEQKLIEVEEKDRLRNFQPPVDGNEIMQSLGIPPGRLVGILKKAVREAILDGSIPNEHDAAFEYLMQVKEDVIRESQDV